MSEFYIGPYITVHTSIHPDTLRERADIGEFVYSPDYMQITNKFVYLADIVSSHIPTEPHVMYDITGDVSSSIHTKLLANFVDSDEIIKLCVYMIKHRIRYSIGYGTCQYYE